MKKGLALKVNILIVDDKKENIMKIREALIKINENIKVFDELCVYPSDDTESFCQDLTKLRGLDNKKEKLDFIKKHIMNNNIDILILDFYWDDNTNTDIDTTDGYGLLDSIRESHGHFSKIPIFSFTWDQETLNAGTVSDKELINSGKLQGAIPKSEQIYDDLNGNRQIIYRILFEAERYQEAEHTDIVVVCALKKEVKPVLSLLEDIHDETETSGIGYITTKGDKKLKVIAITKEQMGMAEAATLTTQMIEKYNPQFVVMTGIAAGVDPASQKPLDILMPTYVHNWQSGKYKVSNSGIEKEGNLFRIFDRNYDSIDTYFKTNNIAIPDELSKIPKNFLRSEGFDLENNEIIDKMKKVINKEINQRSEFEQELVKLEIENAKKNKNMHGSLSLEDEMELEKEIASSLNNDSPSVLKIRVISTRLPCNIYKDGMVSGSAVVADGKLVDERIRQRGVNGIDMEAYGFAHACIMANIKPIIIKSICDFADDEKNDIYQSAAAYASAQVFYKLFTEFIDVEQ